MAVLIVLESSWKRISGLKESIEPRAKADDARAPSKFDLTSNLAEPNCAAESKNEGEKPLRLGGENLGCEIQIFTGLYKFLFKLFMGLDFEAADMSLKDIERKIVGYVMKKKSFAGWQRPQFRVGFFNRARKTPLRKKNEDGLKFVFKKAIKHMKNEFKKAHGLNGHTLSIDEFDMRFYSHFFGAVAEREGIPLLCFYHFRNWKKRTSALIPKSITKRYLALLKKNEGFMRSVREYLDTRFMREFQSFNSNKIRHLIVKWEGILQGCEDVGAGLAEIRRLILKKGSKLPWTASEVRFAFEKTLDSIEKA